MLRLDTTTRKLQILLGGAVTTNELPVSVMYSDKTATTYNGAAQLANTSGASAVDICSPPAASTIRDVDYISVRNSDTAAATVTIRYNDNATLYTIVVATLAVGDTLQYVHGDGWRLLDSNGATRVTAGSNSPAFTGTITGVNLTLSGDLTVSGGTALVDSVTVGDVGTEGSGIDVNGTTYEAALKVSDIGAVNVAQQILHRHSTTVEPINVTARSNSDTSAHGTITAGQVLWTHYAVGWTSTHYDIFGSTRFQVGTGTVSATSSPGKWVCSVTQDGAQTPTDALTIDSNLSAVLAGTLSVQGGQIVFPSTQAASANANTLDDYEEGTFTPVVEGSTTAGTGTYSLQLGRYRKLGSLVHFSLAVQITAHTGTGNIWITGLPFTVNSTQSESGCIGFVENLAVTAGNYVMVYITASTARVTLLQVPTGGGAVSSIPMDTAFTIYVSGCYTTD